MVTSGEGRYCEKSGKIRIIKKGDTVRIPPDVIHWHGAAPDKWFSHISIETNLPNNTTEWLEPVNDEQYNGKEN